MTDYIDAILTKGWIDIVHDEPFYEKVKHFLARTWPPALLKACTDPFFYVVALRSGQKIHFEHATPLSVKWVRLDGVTEHQLGASQETWAGAPFSFSRGIEVRVSDIVWASDAGGYDS